MSESTIDPSIMFDIPLLPKSETLLIPDIMKLQTLKSRPY
jgi:hypothetical protein